jgi:hypothetical protein
VGCIHRARTARIAPLHRPNMNVESLANRLIPRELHIASGASAKG